MATRTQQTICLKQLFLDLEQVFNGDLEIEKIVAQELRAKAEHAQAVSEARSAPSGPLKALRRLGVALG